MTDDDDNEILADHPAKQGSKAGDAERRRQADAPHYASGHPGYVGARLDESAPSAHAQEQVQKSDFGRAAEYSAAATGIPDDAPVAKAWKEFYQGDGINKYTPWNCFLAGWTARDSQ